MQALIHKLEVGGGMRYIRIGLSLLALVLLIVGYNWRAFKNMSTQEAMDAAQLGRNLAQGNGYSTLFVRPFSIYLLKRWHQNEASPTPGKPPDPARLRDWHPDLSHA